MTSNVVATSECGYAFYLTFCHSANKNRYAQIISGFVPVKYDSDDFMILSKLFHSFTVYGKNEFLKSSVLTLKFGRGEKRVV